MDNVRTKRAKKPNPKYSDYETIAALRRPIKQAKLEERISLQPEKEIPLHDEKLKNSVSESDKSITNDLNTLPSKNDIKVKNDVGDTEDTALPISNGQIEVDLIDEIPKKIEIAFSIAPDTSTTTDEQSTVPLNVNGSSIIEKVPSADLMSSIIKNQANLNKRIDNIEVQITNILEILHKKQGNSLIKTQIKDPEVKDILKKNDAK